MTKVEMESRIAELERQVRELQVRQVYAPQPINVPISVPISVEDLHKWAPYIVTCKTGYRTSQ